MNKFIVVLFLILSVVPFLWASEVNINIDGYPVTLEPPQLKDTNAGWILQTIGERLIDEHFGGVLYGTLAQSWSVSKDQLTWTFKLNLDHRFDDNKFVTAADVVASLSEVVKVGNKGRLGHYVKNIRRIYVVNKDFIRFELQKPIGRFLRLLSDASFTIFKRNCSTTMKICFSRHSMRLIEANGKQVKVQRTNDKVIFVFKPLEINEAISEFKKNNLQIIRNYGLGGFREIPTLTESVIQVPDERTFFIALNSRSPKFSNRSDRISFLNSINKSKLRQIIESKSLAMTSSLLSPSLLLHSDNKSMETNLKLPPNLSSANVYQGIMINTNGVELFRGAFDLKQSKVKLLDKTPFVNAMAKGDYDFLLAGYGITIRDVDFLGNFFHSQAAPNFAKISSTGIDEIIDEAISTNNRKLARKKYEEILQINSEEGYYLPLFHIPLVFGLGDKIKVRVKSNILSSPFLDLMLIDVEP